MQTEGLTEKQGYEMILNSLFRLKHHEIHCIIMEEKKTSADGIMVPFEIFGKETRIEQENHVIGYLCDKGNEIIAIYRIVDLPENSLAIDTYIERFTVISNTDQELVFLQENHSSVTSIIGLTSNYAGFVKKNDNNQLEEVDVVTNHDLYKGYRNGQYSLSTFYMLYQNNLKIKKLYSNIYIP